jgi:hypothetical protein
MVKMAQVAGVALTQDEFNHGLMRALDSSLAEAQGKQFYFERPDAPVGNIKALYDAFVALVARNELASLDEVKSWVGQQEAHCSGGDEDQLAARRFLWRLRQNVCSCPIYWRGRRAVGEVG